nr:hypothetical protein CFP56_32979 [Quercus suber]
MGSKAPGWGEQWSAEGYGGNDDDDKLMNKVGNSSGSKMGDVKAAALAGLGKLHQHHSRCNKLKSSSSFLLSASCGGGTIVEEQWRTR